MLSSMENITKIYLVGKIIVAVTVINPTRADDTSELRVGDINGTVAGDHEVV
jgi:hypothetical protein